MSNGMDNRKSVLLKVLVCIIVLIAITVSFLLGKSDSGNKKISGNLPTREMAYYAGFVKGFVYINTTELENFCKDSGYIPRGFINEFNKKFYKTNKNAEDILRQLKLTELVEKSFRDELAKKNSLKEDYEFYKKAQNLSKHDYCKLFDQYKDIIIDEKLDILKEKAPKMYLD